MNGAAADATSAGGVRAFRLPPPGWREAFAVITALAAAAVACWLWPASLHIVAWPRGGPQRVAVFAPLSRLWLWLGIAGAAAAAIWLFAAARRERAAWILAPLNLLWVWTVPFLPWLPDRLPLLVAGAGPLRWTIATLAIGGVLARGLAALPPFALSKGLAVREVRYPRVVAFLSALALYASLGIPAVASTGLGGDEPHYLVITQSLVADGDLKIENNHTRGEHRQFFNGDLRPDYLQRGIDGEIYSIHAPGLSVLLLPGYLIARGLGAVVTAILLAALAALAMFEVARLVSGSARVAWLTWGVAVATVPMIPHAWALYPEIAGAAIVAWAVVWLAAEPALSPVAWAWRGGVLSVLPWLHTKFSVLLAGLTILLAWRIRRHYRLVAALLVPVAIGGIAWLAFFYVIYGRLDPQAPYGGYAAQFVRFENLPRSLLGLFLDSKFGLLVYAPVYGLVISGLLRRDRPAAWPAAYGAALLAAAYIISSARLYMWWGGSSAPARFMVPVIPLLLMPLAWGIGRRRGRAATAAWAVAGVVSVAVAIGGAIGARHLLLFSVPHGVARIIDLVQGSAPLAAALPTFTNENWHEPLRHLTPWLAAVGSGLAVGKGAARWTASPLWIAAAQLLAFAAAAVAMHPSFGADVRQAAATRGSMALLQAFDPRRARAFDYAELTRLTPAEWLARLRVTFDREPGGDPDPQGRLTEALVLPPGAYEATVWFEGGDRPRPGVFQAALGNGYVLARRDEPLPNPATLPLTVPVAVPSLWLQLSDLAAARAVRRVEVQARDVQPAGERPGDLVSAVEAFPGRLQAYVAYVNGDAYPEGGVFWTRGDRRARLRLAPAGAATLVMTLHVGPQAARVDIRVGDVVERLHMAAEETRELRMSLPRGQTSVPIEVRADTSFVPAEVDPSSTDVRQLGCQVRLVLE